MPPGEVTSVVQDYLKAVWSAREWSADEPVTTTMLAKRMGVSPSTASATVRRLAEQGLVRHAPYSSIELTGQGEKLAVRVVRRHRLMETFLVAELGYRWDEAHDDAEILEHAASDRLVERIDAKLGHPTRDPHGDPIPSAEGSVEYPTAVRLSRLATGATGRVARISDADPVMLRYFASIGLRVDAEVRMAERRDFAGVVSVEVAGVRVELGDIAADAVWVADSSE